MRETELVKEFGSPVGFENLLPNQVPKQTIDEAAAIVEENAKALLEAGDDSLTEADKTKATLDRLLDGVSIEPPKDYRPSDFALTFVNFIKLVNGEEGEENKTPIIHYYLLDGFASDHDRIAIMVFRGAAKTTLFEYLILYLAIFQELPGIGKLNCAIYMSDTIDNGVENMQKNLQHRWENSEFLQKQLPTAKLLKVTWTFRNADGKPFVVKGFGAASGFRGFKVMGKRPKLALLDDLISDTMAESDTEMAKVERTIRRGIQPALNTNKNKIIWAGTPFNERDPLCKSVCSGAWSVYLFPVCQKFPCKESEFVGAWSDRFTYKHVKRQHEIAVKDGDTAAFYRELMLRTVAEEDKLVNTKEDIMWYSEVDLQHYRGNKTYLITTDLSYSGKSTADKAVIDVWEIHPDEKIYWVDGMAERPDVLDTMDVLFAFIKKYRVLPVGIEISAQQIVMVRVLEKEMEDRDIFFQLVGQRGRPPDEKGIRPVTNKLVRFKQAVLPIIKRRKIHFPVERKNDEIITEKLHQLDSVTRTGITCSIDDDLDSITMVGLIEIVYPSAGEATENEDEQFQANLDPQVWGPLEEPDDGDDYYDSYLA